MIQLNRFLADESGATMIEYALIASLIAVALIGTVGQLSNKVGGTFNKIGNSLG